MARKKITIFTDGACSGNPGRGGYAAILRFKDKEKEICGFEQETTNNRMELTAVIEALKAVKEPCDIEIFSDSKYVVDAFLKGWVDTWQKNNWKKSDKKPVLNLELWQELLAVAKPHNINFYWVKGHDKHPENERCDKLAVAAAKKGLSHRS